MNDSFLKRTQDLVELAQAPAASTPSGNKAAGIQATDALKSTDQRTKMLAMRLQKNLRPEEFQSLVIAHDPNKRIVSVSHKDDDSNVNKGTMSRVHGQMVRNGYDHEETTANGQTSHYNYGN